MSCNKKADGEVSCQLYLARRPVPLVNTPVNKTATPNCCLHNVRHAKLRSVIPVPYAAQEQAVL